MKNPLSLIRPNIAALTPYSTARDEYKGKLGVFLDANESPYDNTYNRYPDPRQVQLKQKIGAIKGIGTDRIFIGNGSDEAIDLCFRIFCEPHKDNIVAITPSYGMYTVAAAINDVAVREVQLNDDFSLPGNALTDACDRNTKLMFICSPNNPSGNAFKRADLVRVIEAFEGMVVLDEAYIDFADVRSFLTDLDRYPNLIVLQTLSKAWGMAGLRLGLAFGQPEVMRLFGMVKYPYNINITAIRTVTELLEGDIRPQVAEVKRERTRVSAELATLTCIQKVYRSDANFVLVKCNDAEALYDKLIAAQIIVRNRSTVKGCSGCLRITIGTPEENDKMLATIKEYDAQCQAK